MSKQPMAFTRATWPRVHRAFGAALVAAGKDKMRPLLCSVNVVSDGETLTVQATDSYRIHRAVVDVAVTPFEANIPAAWFKTVLPKPMSFSPAERGDVIFQVSVEKNTVRVEDVDARTAFAITNPSVTGEFPNTTPILADADTDRQVPEGEPVAWNLTYHVECLRAAKLFAGKNPPQIVSRQRDVMQPARYDMRGPEGDTLTMVLMPARLR